MTRDTAPITGGDEREVYLRENLRVVLPAVMDMANTCISAVKAANPAYETEGRDRARVDFIREVCERWAALSLPVHTGEAVAWPKCQVCGGLIEGWTCQSCGAGFKENDAGALVLSAPKATGGEGA